MILSPGARLGPYEIVAPLGAGGMGEVYRARDPRIGREVAIKVLPSAVATDPDRLRRFEQEVRAAGALNHPNILIIYDVGNQDGSPYIVSELLEGQTLRERMAAALPARKVIDYAQQIARGLAAAYDKGIVHRDLKPENLFLTNDGRVKILDFGLAKLTHAEASEATGSSAPTMDAGTDPGAVLGTMGYMSPEQVRGKPADHRSDIFSFGAVLYEMLSGQRAFRGQSVVETMHAILKDEPPDLVQASPSVPPALDRILRRCLEKQLEQRFQSASDLTFALETLSGISTLTAVPPGLAKPDRWPRQTLVLALAFAAIALLAFWAGRSLRTEKPSAFRQLTFRRGGILSARFAPDSQTIIYGAAWEGKPLQLFATRPESPESRPLGLPDADILSISPAGEMAISLGRSFLDWWTARGTLARVPMTGGAPREVLENVQEAAWGPGPDGPRLAVVRTAGGRSRIEFPLGKSVYETAGGISHARVSPRGDKIAFIEHPFSPDDTGLIAVTDLAAKKRDLTPRYVSAQGLAWSPSGDEIWYTASEAGVNCALRAVTLSGKIRLLYQAPGRLVLQDISRDGRVLLSRENWRVGFAGLFPGDTVERDLSWLDLSFSSDLSADGKTVLISEQGEGGGSQYAVYIRKTDGSPAVRLGEGFGVALSPDSKWAVSFLRSSPPQLVLLPAGAGEMRTLPRGPIESYGQEAGWFKDGKRIAFSGSERGRGARVYVQDITGGLPRPVSPEGITFSGHTVSPDGQFVAGLDPEQKIVLCPVAGGEPRPLAGTEPPDRPVAWSGDGRWIYLMGRVEVPMKLYRVEVLTGRKELWKEIKPADPAGFLPFFFFQMTPDARFYAYTYARVLSDLYLMEGLK